MKKKNENIVTKKGKNWDNNWDKIDWSDNVSNIDEKENYLDDDKCKV